MQTFLKRLAYNTLEYALWGRKSNAWKHLVYGKRPPARRTYKASCI